MKPNPVSSSVTQSRLSPLVLGTRTSALARWQTDWVMGRLRDAWPDLACVSQLFTTAGDRNVDKPLPELGGKGVFTEELENALRAGEIDLAVHSLKDLPIDDSPGLTLGAICRRADARDVLIARDRWTLTTLPPGARVGTCSLRRSAQLLAARSDLKPHPVRGNIDTRIRKALRGDFEAIVLAAAGVLRLGLDRYISAYLPFDVMLPAPGQAALAVQCRAQDARACELLQPLEDAPTRAAVTAERAFLRALGGGCSAPVAAYAQTHASSSSSRFQVSLVGSVASLDGRRVIRVSGQDFDSVALGEQLAQQALAQGAGELLA